MHGATANPARATDHQVNVIDSGDVDRGLGMSLANLQRFGTVAARSGAWLLTVRVRADADEGEEESRAR